MKYIIDKTYTFLARTDSGYDEISYHVRYNHEEVLKLGRYFLDQDIEDDEISCGFDIKDKLDQKEMESIAYCLLEEWESEQNNMDYDEVDDLDEEVCESKTLEDFYDRAWQILGTDYYYYCWSPELKKDCIDYYKTYNEE